MTEQIKQSLMLDPRLANVNEFLLAKYVKRVIHKVLSHCNREDIPVALYDVIEQITERMLEMDGFIKTEKQVSSISRGDMSISYEASKALDNVAEFVNDFECQLMHFKRLRLPKDEPR